MMRLAVLLAFLAVPLQAQVYTGLYGLGDQDGVCYPYPDGQMQINADEIIFYESRCGLSNPRLVSGMGGAVQYTATCSGEGETWTREFILMQARHGGVFLMQPGFVSEYHRCP